MIRYLAFATVLVVGAIVLATFLPGGSRGDAVRHERYVTATGTPGPYQRQAGPGATAPPMRGVASWALSALPECFRQVAIVRGTRAYVDARAGAGLRPVPTGASLASADCRLRAAPDRIAVARGDDVRLVVPDVVRFATVRHGAAVDTVVVEVAEGARRVLRRYRMPRGARVTRAPHATEPNERAR